MCGYLGSPIQGILCQHAHAPMNTGLTGARWPDTWLPEGADAATALRFSRRWVNVHADVCKSALGKPLVLTEFGIKAGGRPAFYEKARARPDKQACPLSGWVTWSLKSSVMRL